MSPAPAPRRMRLPRALLLMLLASALVFGLAVAMFYATADPMVLVFMVYGVGLAWLVLAVVWFVKRTGLAEPGPR
jgi:hypothetical protein